MIRLAGAVLYFTLFGAFILFAALFSPPRHKRGHH
jgi:hypothetical protein